MGMGLTNAMIGMSNSGRRANVQKVAPARPSIAEDAKFVPKPHKRVSFKLNTEPRVMKPSGTPKNAQPVPVMGQDKGQGEKVDGSYLLRGSLGEFGVTAMFTTEQWHGTPNAAVTMEIDATPEKDFTVIQTQEEGRQTHNTFSNTHPTQQYDAYGRPRIGFSREPYDFAATKYIVATSQIKFQENVKSTQQTYDGYSANPLKAEKDLTTPEITVFGMDQAMKPGMIDSEFKDAEIMGQDKLVSGKMAGTDTVNGMIDTEEGVPAISDGKTEQGDTSTGIERSTGMSAMEVAEKMGIDVKAIFTPNDPGKAAAAHDVTGLEAKAAISVSA